MKNIHLVVCTTQNCRNPILPDILGLNRILPAMLRNRLRIEYVQCPKTRVGEKIQVFVDGTELINPSISAIVDAIYTTFMQTTAV